MFVHKFTNQCPSVCGLIDVDGDDDYVDDDDDDG